MGLVSMISFIILYKMMDGEITPELNKIFKTDVIGLFVLVVGCILFKLKR